MQSYGGYGCCLFYGNYSDIADPLQIVTPFDCNAIVFGPYLNVFFSVLSMFAIIPLRKRKLVHQHHNQLAGVEASSSSLGPLLGYLT